MIRHWICMTILALLVAALVFSVTRRRVCDCRHDPLAELHDVGVLKVALSLTPEQHERIRSLHVKLAARLKDCCVRHCAARRRIGEVLSDPAADQTVLESMLHELCRAYSESESAVLEHIGKVRELLDDDQRQRFEQMLTERFCRTCALCDVRP